MTAMPDGALGVSMCTGSNEALVLSSRWNLAVPERFSLLVKPRPADPSRGCIGVAGGQLGSSCGLQACARPADGFVWRDLGGGAAALQDPSGWCFDGELRLTQCVPGSAASISARCTMCPGRELSAGAWSMVGLITLAIVVLPWCVPMLHAKRRAGRTSGSSTSTADADGAATHQGAAAQWPQRHRLTGIAGVLAPLGWVFLITSQLPLALWLFADAWPGHSGWWLTLCAPGAGLMYLMVRPTDSPVVFRVLYACAYVFLSGVVIIASFLVFLWSSDMETGGSQYGVLAVRDANVALISLCSLVALCRGDRGGLNSTKGKALALSRFVKIVRIDAGLFGLVWLCEAIVRMIMWPALQMRNQHIWCNAMVGLSAILTALVLKPAWVLRMQTLRNPMLRIQLVMPKRFAPAHRGSASSPRHQHQTAPVSISEAVLNFPPSICTDQSALAWEGAGGADYMYASSNITLLEAIGRGGFSMVYSATDSAGQRVAVKLLTMHSLRSEKAVRLLRRELTLGCELRHPHLCATLGLATIGSFPAMVLELCEGGPLSDALFEKSDADSGRDADDDKPPPPRQTQRAPLSVEACLRILSESASGLAHLHAQGIMHRDLKPENVLLDAELRAKICDFGLSTRDDLEMGMTTKSSIGTPRYLAPEVIFGAFTQKADVYSFAMLTYAILHRRPPFEGMNAYGVLATVTYQQSRPEVDVSPALAPFADIMVRCWDASTEVRPTMSSVEQQLADALAGAPGVAGH